MNAIVPGPLTGELLLPDEIVSVGAAMHPFKPNLERFDMPAGVSLDEIVNECAARGNMPTFVQGAVVELNGEEIDPLRWPRIRVKAGSYVFVRAKARGSVFKTVLSLALAVLSIFVAGPAGLAFFGSQLAASVAATAIIIGGTLLLNALFPPTSLKTDNSQSYSIGGTRNEVSRWGPIPVVLGKLRIAPKFAASPYTEFVDDDQYVRNLYVFAQGPLALSDPKIGETKTSEFQDLQLEMFGGLPGDGKQTLYPGEVVPADYTLEITQKNSPHERGIADDGNEVQFDLLAPQGIVNVQTKSGKKKKLEVRGTASLIDENTGGVIATIPWDMSDNDNNPKRKTFFFRGFAAPTKDLKLSINRTSPDYDDEEDSDHYDNITLTAVRVFRPKAAITYSKPLAQAAIRILATKQLNGNPDDFNVMAQSLAPVWNGNAWVMNQPTSNCASLGLLVLMGQGAAKPYDFGEIDNNSWVRFFNYCELYGFKFNMYRDFTASVYDTLAQVLAAGRGVRINVDGKVGVSFEDPNAQVKQLLSPRNSRDFSVKITYQDLPHALRVKFVNEKKDYIEDEKIVFFDGYSGSNATLFEQVEFPGVTDPDLIYKHARYRIAEMFLRNAVYTLTTDFEHIVLNRGDRVNISHDIIDEMIVSARVVSKTAEGSGYRIVIDEDISLDPTKAYAVRCRRDDGTSSVFRIQYSGDTRANFYVEGIDAKSFIPGQLMVVGLVDRVGATYRVLRIRKMKDLMGEIDFVDDAPGIMQADNGPVPGDPGVVVIPPPLKDFRPYGLQISQFLFNDTGFVSQITRFIWKVPPGGPPMSAFLIVLTDSDGKEYRGATANGTTFSFDYVNLPTGDYYVVVQGFTADGLYTGFSDPYLFSQSLPEDSLGFDYEALNEEVRKEIQQVVDEQNAALESFRSQLTSELNDLAKEAATGAVVAEISKESEARKTETDALARDISSVKAIANGAASAVSTETTARSNADESLSSRITTALSVAQNASSAVTSEQTARANADNSLSQQITAAIAQTNSVSASGYYRLLATGNGSDGHARFEVQVNAGTPANPNWAYAGFRVEAWMEGGVARSRVVLVAQRVAIGNDAGAQYVPFIVDGGVVYMNNAFIRKLTAINIEARAINAETIALGGVDLSNILDGAVSSLATGEATGSYVNVPLEVKYGRVLLDISIAFQASSGTGSCAFSIYRSGSLLRQITITSPRVQSGENGNGGAIYTQLNQARNYKMIDYPPVGQHRYDIVPSVYGGSYSALSLINLRK